MQLGVIGQTKFPCQLPIAERVPNGDISGKSARRRKIGQLRNNLGIEARLSGTT